MSVTMLGSDVLDIDCAAEVGRICARLTQNVAANFHRRGTVIALSGGVDSSVCAALSARALGHKKVLALLLPEKESGAASTGMGRMVAEQLDIECWQEDITPILEAVGCYRWRDQAIRTLIPEYSDGWRNKMVIAREPGGGFSFFKIVVQSPDGGVMEKRLPYEQYLQIVAATSFKQRTRKALEYFHADRLNYAVIGTPNRLEYDQGFFVKNGDGSADIKPIAHLYKTQVYALARYLGLPEEVCHAIPSTDTYSLEQGQDEFYFGLPYQQMDMALWAHNHAISSAALAKFFGIREPEAAAIYTSIEAKRKSTRYLHARPVLVEAVSEVGG